MKDEKNQAQVSEDIARQFHHDRVFLNNPIMMQGMGLAPMVVVATSAENALMLAVAVLLLLTPTRVIANLALREVKFTLLRVVGYVLIASLIYFGVYWVMSVLFATKLLSLGIYLPMLVVEPLIIYRFARVPEPFAKGVVKGLRMTLGYAVVLAIVGCLREFLAVGTLYGISIVDIQILPIAATPAGGFLLLGVLCAVWRTFANRHRKYMMMEARLER